jgi:hypothetical protein
MAAYMAYEANSHGEIIGITHFMQSLTGVIGEQSKHGTHGKIEYGLRDTNASIYAHLCSSS